MMMFEIVKDLFSVIMGVERTERGVRVGVGEVSLGEE